MAADAKKTPSKTPSTPAVVTRSRRSNAQLAPSQPPAETPDNANKNEKKKQPADAAGKTRSVGGRKRRRKSEPGPVEPDAGAGSSKKPQFDRIWSEEDEIKLLLAILHCVKEYGVDPDSATDQVTEYMRDTLNMPFSRDQVYKKARRMKHRWELASAKLKTTGRGPAKDHYQALFKLSQEIWEARDETREEAQVSSSPSEEEAPISLPSEQQAPVLPLSEEEEAAVSSPQEEEEAAVTARSDCLRLERVVVRVAKERGLNWEMIKLVLRGLRRLPPERAKELEEQWTAHTLQGVKYSLADDKLKSETLRDCVESLERGEFS